VEYGSNLLKKEVCTICSTTLTIFLEEVSRILHCNLQILLISLKKSKKRVTGMSFTTKVSKLPSFAVISRVGAHGSKSLSWKSPD
jgi:hypothetical protein